MNIGIVLSNTVCNGLKQGGFSCLGLRNNKASLTFADGGDQVYKPNCKRLLAVSGCFKGESLVREDRVEILKRLAQRGFLGTDAVDRRDVHKSNIAIVLSCLARFARYKIAGAEAETADLGV